MKDENLAVRAAGLTKSYQGRTVLNGLDLAVRRGTVFGLLGANGAGKSTTIECILGTRRADSGTVSVLGHDPKKERGALFQRVGAGEAGPLPCIRNGCNYRQSLRYT